MRPTTAVFAALLFAVGAQAQHSMLAGQMVGGRNNPSAVPDSVAYRVWFIRLSHAFDDEAKIPGRVEATMIQTSLNEVDQSVVKGAVLTWKAQFFKLVADWNSTPEEERTPTKQAAFEQSIFDMTMSTVKTINAGLSEDGLKKFTQFIQNEKRNISVNTGTR